MTHKLTYSTGKVYTHVLPAEIYVTGVLPVAVVGAEPAECRVTCFTVLRLTLTNTVISRGLREELPDTLARLRHQTSTDLVDLFDVVQLRTFVRG